MESIQNNNILEFKHDTLQYLRKQYNFDTPQRLKDAIDILHGWIEKQSHFNKKDFSQEYLERVIILSKGSIEKAKQKLDKTCTFRTTMPQFYGVFDPKNDFKYFTEVIMQGIIPKLTEDHYRIYILKHVTKSFTMGFLNLYRFLILTCEYLQANDYCNGIVVILDYTQTSLLEVVKNCNLLELQQIITIITEGYNFRIKEINVITASKAIDALLSLFKQSFSEKIAQRIQIHGDYNSLRSRIPQDMLPLDYGGNEASLKQLNNNLIDELGLARFKNHIGEMMNARTEESRRSLQNFNEQYLGTPGSFRMFNVD